MSATRSPVTSSKGVVSAGNAHAVSAGLDALERGGNAVDATVAAAFVSFVAEPNNAGIAGYGHLAAFTGGAFVTVDHGPRAPLAATPDMFTTVGPEPEGYDWPEVADDANALGHLAPAVPGAVAGLHAIHARAGRLPWASLLDAAIALADEGLEVTWNLLLLIAAHLDEIRVRPALAAILLPEGRLPRARTEDEPGERLHQRELADTLRRVAEHGPDGFYRGAVAEAIAAEIAAGGGILDDRGPRDLRAEAAPRAADPLPRRRARHRQRPGRDRGAEHPRLLPRALARAGGAPPPARRGDGPRVRRQRHLRRRSRPRRRAARGPGQPRLRAAAGVGDRAGRGLAAAAGDGRPVAVRGRRGARDAAAVDRRGTQARRRSSPPTPTATSSRSSRRSATTSGRRSRCPARASCSTTR